MKIRFTIAILFLFSIGLRAQPFKVGDTTCNYKLVNLSFASYTTAPCYGSGGGSFSLDLDGDFVSDVSIGSSAYQTCSAQFPYWNGIIASASASVTIVHGPSALSPCPNSAVSNVAFGTQLTPALNWSVTSFIPSGGDINYNYGSTVGPSYYTCGAASSSFYMAFRKILSGDTIYGWLLMDSNQPGKIISYAFKHTAPKLTGVAFTNTNTGVCAGSNLTLTASPPGGVFNGANVSGNIFNSPSSGTFPVYYTDGCTNAATLNITVNASPNTSLSVITNSICLGDSLTLNGSPAGGTYSGAGVSGNTFYSSLTGPGLKQVYYAVTGSNGCSRTATLNINVYPTAIPVSITSSKNVSCNGESVTLTGHGALTYTWSTGATTPSIVVSPIGFGSSYTVTGALNSAGHCSNTATYAQYVISPTVNATASSSSICAGKSISLQATGAASYTWSTGKNGPFDQESPLSTATYSVIGSNTYGCTDTAFVTVMVNNQNMVLAATSSHSMSCPGDSVALTLSGSPANTYTVNGGPGAYYTLNGSSSVVVHPSITTTYTITGPFSVNGCPAIGFFTQYVSCVGIAELGGPVINFSILPNPNSGEFDIKGTKEETIYITNQVGQLIETRSLRPENNYSVKIADLPDGLYFVGSGRRMQKVVVIR